jgi:hypothetical protein
MAPGRPVVALVCSAPLLAEALGAALAGVAEVLALPGRASDLGGLLGSLTPAGVVVDDPDDAAAATAYARRTGAPLVHVRLREAAVAVWDGLGWRDVSGEPSAEHVRNLVVAGLASRSTA